MAGIRCLDFACVVFRVFMRVVFFSGERYSGGSATLQPPKTESPTEGSETRSVATALVLPRLVCAQHARALMKLDRRRLP